MALKITDDCINCGACEIECPSNAVYPKTINPAVKEPSYINNNLYSKEFVSSKHYYINPYQCNDCKSIFSSPRCDAVCPVACCLIENECYTGNVFKIISNPVLITRIGLN